MHHVSRPTIRILEISLVQTNRLQRQIREPVRTNPSGLLAYSSTGLMTVQLGRRFSLESTPDSSDPAYNLHSDAESLEELRATFESYLAYYGTFDLDVATTSVIHNVLGSNRPSLIGKRMQRFFNLDGDLLTLAPPPSEQVAAILVWQRIHNSI